MAGSKSSQGAIRFYGPFDRSCPADLKLRNATRRTVIFRFKCSNSSGFTIKPSGIGLLRPKQDNPLTLTSLPELDRNAESAFILEYTAINVAEKEPEPDLVEAWSRIKADAFTKTNFKAVFISESKEQAERVTTVITINERRLKGPETQSTVADVIWRIRRQSPDIFKLLGITLAVLGAVSFIGGLWVGSKMKNSGGQNGNNLRSKHPI